MGITRWLWLERNWENVGRWVVNVTIVANKKLTRRWDIRTWHRSILLYTLLRLTPPTEGFPWDDLRKILHGGQRMAKIHRSEEILPKTSTSWVGCTNVTTRFKRHLKTFSVQLNIRLPVTMECASGLTLGGALQMQLLLLTVTDERQTDLR